MKLMSLSLWDMPEACHSVKLQVYVMYIVG